MHFLNVIYQYLCTQNVNLWFDASFSKKYFRLASVHPFTPDSLSKIFRLYWSIRMEQTDCICCSEAEDQPPTGDGPLSWQVWFHKQPLFIHQPSKTHFSPVLSSVKPPSLGALSLTHWCDRRVHSRAEGSSPAGRGVPGEPRCAFTLRTAKVTFSETCVLFCM